MTRLQIKILVVLVTILAVAFFYPFVRSQTALSPDAQEPTISYYLLSSEETPETIPFEGCGDDYLLKYDSITTGGLQEALDELFSIQDGFKSALTNSEIEVAISNGTINLQGQLISAGTCDDPRVKNQIIKTIELYTPEGEYNILLNGSESEWRCWSDQSGLCE